MKKMLIFMFCVCTILAESCPEITSGSDVSGKVIKNCSYKGKNLSGVNFTGAEMEDVDFSNANLGNAKFNDLKNAQFLKFVNADFTGAEVKGSTIKNSDFSFSKWQYVDASPLSIGIGLRESNLAEGNVFYGIETNAETNVSEAHLPLGFFMASSGKYTGVPYFYFG